MVSGILRAATAALVLVIAILVYVNYVRSGSSSATEHSESASAPEAPEVPVIPAPLPLAAQPSANVANDPAAQPEVQHPSETHAAATPAPAHMARAARPAQPQSQSLSQPQVRPEILDSNDIVEVVELPPAPGSRGGVSLAAAKPTGKRTHVVQPGESLWSISKKYLGNGEFNGKIADANALTSKDKIRAGQVLIIPELNGNKAVNLPNAMPTPPALIHASAPGNRVSEDLADDEDARSVSSVSHSGHNNSAAAVNASVKVK